MDLDRPLYVSLATLMGHGDSQDFADGEPGFHDSELTPLKHMDFSMMSRSDFMELARLAESSLNVSNIMGALISMARSGWGLRIPGLLIDMRLRASTADRQRLVKAVKNLLEHHVRVVLVDGDGYCVNLSELDEFCTSRDFVEMYMGGIFSAHWSFSLAPKVSAVWN